MALNYERRADAFQYAINIVEREMKYRTGFAEGELDTTQILEDTNKLTLGFEKILNGSYK